MKIYYPTYYKKFSCIADKCTDSCCKKWEIVIDEDTFQKYQAVEGDFGNKIRSSIVEDEEGSHCFALNGENCPFLNSSGLCDIHINLGEDFTSAICKAHPRFTEEYDAFTEICLSLSCPEASRIIFGCDIRENYYPAPDYQGDDEVLSILIQSRKRLLDANCSFSELINEILNTSADDSLDIDNVYIADFPEFDIQFIKDFLVILNNNEILTSEWKNMLGCAIDSTINSEDYFSSLKANENELLLFCRYMLYRYYLKAVNDLDIYSRSLFIVSSCFACIYISAAAGIDFSECARLFSKETEHNTQNLDNIIDYFSNF